ncbi:ShlB/FhaC/HecB family hemolysin secretion/activation protein [Arcobacter sp. YIC-310]|uniref:ShlB/FhaC/HecB family hemolysin secretion/activation protein n=1 Tax=Arcobacter sp. YIC-310 TaxID=3376632 RepID=UPI003C20AF99
MKKINIIALSLITSVSLQAANIPNIGDALKQVTPPKIQEQNVELPKLEQKQDIKKILKDGKKVLIKEIKLEGNIHLDNKEFEELLKPHKNVKLSFADIQEISSEITKIYRKSGYFVARAYIPQQNIFKQDRVLKIGVIEGNYGKFNLENNSLVKDSILQANLDDIKDKNIVSTDTLERAMLIINATPGSVVNKAEVRPGEKLGTSDFIIGTAATNRYSGYILADNYGSQYTGEHRLMAGVDINSPFKIGDKITAFALTSQNTGLLNGRISYDFPLNQNGLRGEVSVSKTSYELGDSYKDLDAIGSSNSVSLKISYPYIKSRLENLDVYFEVSYNDMLDEIKATSTKTDKESTVGKVGLDYTKDLVLFTKNAQSKASMSLTFGDLDDKENEYTDGNFKKINIELGQDFQLNRALRWENSLQYQHALKNKNLDGSEDLSIGGANGVKFYPSGEQSAENGYIFNTELIYNLPTYKALSSKVSAFYDVARVYENINISGDKSNTYQDVGLGYYATYKSFFLNTHLSKGIGYKVQSQNKYENRFMFQAGFAF